MNQNLEEDLIYKKSLREANRYHPVPVGLSSHEGTGKTDSIVIKQNNTIIALLIELNQKLEKIITDKEKAEKQHKQEVAELAKKFDKIEVTPQKDKKALTVKTKEWTFFRVEPEQSKK